MTALSGCKKKEPATTKQTLVEPEGVIASGRFENVGKRVSGRAQLENTSSGYVLRLLEVQLDAAGPIHVYLVGLDEAKNTRAVDEAELKYDMGPLDDDKAEQVIQLPGKPDPALRSIVLWNPTYGANLAAASLR
jgi:hypothetical protein